VLCARVHPSNAPPPRGLVVNRISRIAVIVTIRHDVFRAIAIVRIIAIVLIVAIVAVTATHTAALADAMARCRGLHARAVRNGCCRVWRAVRFH
jgi:hypothetical protein